MQTMGHAVREVKLLWRSVGAVAVVLLLGWLLLPRVLEGWARWLAVQDDPRPADAIVVLGGGEGERIAEAVRLYERGLAPRIIILGPASPVLPLSFREDAPTMPQAKKIVALRKGVPEDAVEVVEGPTSTYEEALAVARILQERGYRRILVVTSPFHSRRARQTFRKVVGSQGVAVLVIHPPWDRSTSDPERWWRRERDTMRILVETLKMGYYALRYRIFPF
jgi:uncharacterized SAM-binding protein YcdF (DUF218 family)